MWKLMHMTHIYIFYIQCFIIYNFGGYVYKRILFGTIISLFIILMIPYVSAIENNEIILLLGFENKFTGK